MNRKQRRAQARSDRSRQRRDSAQSDKGRYTAPRHDPRVEPTLAARADSEDHQEFRDHMQAALAAPHPSAFLDRASSFIAVGLDEHYGVETCAKLIERVQDDDSVIGLALLIALAALAPLADDRAHAQRLAQLRPQSQHDELPGWLNNLDQAYAVKAMEHSDLWWDRSFQAIELAIGGHELTVFIDIDHVAGFAASRADIASESIAAFFDEFPQTLLEPGTTTRYLTPVVAGRRFEHAICQSFDQPSLQTEPDLVLSEPLVRWAGRLGVAGSLGGNENAADLADLLELFDRETTGLDQITTDFLHSSHGQRAVAEGVAVDIHTIVSYAAQQGHRRPLAWGPMRIADFLLRHIPEQVWSSVDAFQSMPQLLHYWIAYVNELCEMPPDMASESVERIDQCAPFFRAIVDSRESSLKEFTQDLVANRP